MVPVVHPSRAPFYSAALQDTSAARCIVYELFVAMVSTVMNI